MIVVVKAYLEVGLLDVLREVADPDGGGVLPLPPVGHGVPGLDPSLSVTHPASAGRHVLA